MSRNDASYPPIRLEITLNLSNFREWERELRRVLKPLGLEYLLNFPNPGQRELTSEQFKKMLDDHHYVINVILNSIPKSWAKRFKDYRPHLIIVHLRDICRDFLHPIRTDPNVEQVVASIKEQGDPWGIRYRPEISKTLELVYSTKLKYGQSLHEHVSTMIRLYERLELLGDPMDNEKKIDSMIHSLEATLSGKGLWLTVMTRLTSLSSC